nr:hypothetical protein [Luteipulveratus halotolerans]
MDLAEQALLVAELVVQRSAGEARGGDEVLGGDPVVPAVGEERAAGADQRRTGGF